MAMKKGPTKGSGGKHRNKLKGYGPTPKAEDRVYHKAYKAKKANERRQIADPRLAARMPVARVVNLTKAIEGLKERGYYVVGLDGGGDKLVGETGFETDPLVVVLGSEGSGLSRLVRESCDAIAGIPISSSVESLNASVAAGISLYAVSRARREGAESAQ